MARNNLRLALLISGGGTTMREILSATQDSRLEGVRPVLVIASRPDAGGIEKAISSGVMTRPDVIVLQRKQYPTAELFGEMILAECRKRDVNFVGQYGWLPLTPTNVIEAYRGRIVNQHPGPLDPGQPDFGGKGMYGRRVHAARLLFTRMTNREDWTEVVCHRVTEEYDRGVVLHARRVPILKEDDVAALQGRSLPVEHQVQIETLRMIADETVRETVSTEPLVRVEEVEILQTAKRMAQLLYPNG